MPGSRPRGRPRARGQGRLVDSISATPEFDNAVELPPDFTGTQVSVPHPSNGSLYLKLRDDPETAQTLTLPVRPMTPQEQPTALPAQTPAPALPAPAAAPEPANPQLLLPPLQLLLPKPGHEAGGVAGRLLDGDGLGQVLG